MPFDTKILESIVERYNKELEHQVEDNQHLGLSINNFEPLSFDKHPVQVVASRMIAILAMHHYKFAESLSKVIECMPSPPQGLRNNYASNFKLSHVTMWAEDKENVVLFPNLSKDKK